MKYVLTYLFSHFFQIEIESIFFQKANNHFWDFDSIHRIGYYVSNYPCGLGIY